MSVEAFLRSVSEWSDLHDTILKRLEIVPLSENDRDTIDSLSISAKKSLIAQTAFGTASTIDKLDTVLNRMYKILRHAEGDIKERMHDIVVMIESDFQFKERTIREICDDIDVSSSRKNKLLTMYRQKSFLNSFIVERSMHFLRRVAAET